jgi:hypothetical protein
MIKKEYQKPTVNVVKIQYQSQIFAGSPPKTLEGKSTENYEDLG